MLSFHPTFWLTAAATALLGYLGATGGEYAIPEVSASVVQPTFHDTEDARQDTHGLELTGKALRAPQLIKIVRSADGLFYMNARINGMPIRFVVDTGANLVVLTPMDAQRAGVASSGAAASIDTVGGSSQMPRAMIQKVAIANLQAANIDAAIMRGGLKVSLLGQNVLAKLGIITMSGDELSIQTQS